MDSNISNFLSRIEKLLQGTDSSREFRFARVLKLNEEIGELSQAVLATQNLESFSYKDKTDEDVLSELADVFVTTLAVLKTFDFDVEEYLSMIDRKISKWENIVQKQEKPSIERKQFIVFQGNDKNGRFMEFSEVLDEFDISHSSKRCIYFLTKEGDHLSVEEFTKLREYLLVNPDLIIIEPCGNFKKDYQKKLELHESGII